MEEEPKSVARTAARRPKGVLAGAATLWCTLAALTAPSWQSQIASLAVATASHFTTLDGQTSSILQGELGARDATGLQAGRTEHYAPTRGLATGDSTMTVRDMLKGHAPALKQLVARLLRESGEDALYYHEWADAARPLDLAELSSEQLDQSLPIDDPSLSDQLFSRPLPVYETPWLEKAPNQVWEDRPGCAGFVANTALDLVDAEARAELHEWFEAAWKDAQCLEQHGENCDRSDKPRSIAIGQTQVHQCARGYVWDCRERPCRLLQHDGAISTDWDLDYLRDKLKGYPDQRLASNVLEGVRLEADLDLITVLCPQLVSIGIGHESVQKTVRELKKRHFYDFSRPFPSGQSFWQDKGHRSSSSEYASTGVQAISADHIS